MPGGDADRIEHGLKNHAMHVGSRNKETGGKMDAAAIKRVEGYIDGLWDIPPAIASEIHAHERQVAVVKIGASLIRELVEPFQNHGKFIETSECCLCIHLYARILDDAVDEALPVHRINLLKIQPMFWDSVARLSRMYSDKSSVMQELIQETIDAVVQEWKEYAVETWGSKNHHLLLAPLLLTDTTERFMEFKPFLSDFLFLLQAKEEIGEMRVEKMSMKNILMHKLEMFSSEKWVHRLRHAGWRTIADRIPGELHFIRSCMEK